MTSKLSDAFVVVHSAATLKGELNDQTETLKHLKKPR